MTSAQADAELASAVRALGPEPSAHDWAQAHVKFTELRRAVRQAGGFLSLEPLLLLKPSPRATLKA